MGKKIFFVAVVLAFLGGLAWFFLRFEDEKAPVSDSLIAIPTNAALIIQSTEAQKAWQKLAQTSVIWEELSQTESFARIDRAFALLDSLVDARADLQTMMVGKVVTVSAHMAGANNYNWLFSVSLPPAGDENIVHQAVKDLAAGPPTSKVYDQATIHNVPVKGEDLTFSWSIYRGVFFGSYSTLLVEDAVRQINSGTSILDDPAFTRAMSTAGAKNDANVFIKHNSLPPVVATYLGKEHTDGIEFLEGYAGWSELDAESRPNTMLLNGFTVAPDSMDYFLGTFTKQRPQEVEMLSVLPSNTATLIHMGFTDFAGWGVRFRSWLKAKNQLFEFEKDLNRLNEQYEMNGAARMLSWVEYEIAFAITEPNDTEFDNNAYAILRTSAPSVAEFELTRLIKQVDAKSEAPSDSTNHRGYPIRQIQLPGLFEALFGTLFAPIRGNYFTALGNYYVFANSPEALKQFINKFEAEKTLEKDENFQVFAKNLADESNMLIYSNIARSINIYQQFLDKQWAAEVETHTELFRKFEGMALQVSVDRPGMYYNSLFVKHNPVYKQETGSLWELALDTAVLGKPWLVDNHYTKAKEIVVQDVANKLYLISNTGKILWTKQLEQPVVSEVVQIDGLRNGKLQLLFHTKDQLWLLDRNGKKVGSFPVRLKVPASGPMAVMDYDHNRKYRILIPCANNEVYNYNSEGKLVDGWSFKAGSSPIRQALKHFAVEGKDYIIGVEENGTIHAVDRRGATRHTVNATMPGGMPWFLHVGNTLSESAIVSSNDSGQIVRLSFNETLERVELPSFEQMVHFQYSDVTRNGLFEYVVADSNRLAVYDQALELVFSTDFEANISAAPQLFEFPDNVAKVGAVTQQSNEIWLFNQLGALHEGLPLPGTTSFAIGDLNQDGTLELVVGNADKNLYTYTLE